MSVAAPLSSADSSFAPVVTSGVPTDPADGVTAALRVDRVVKNYGQRQALREISFAIPPGQRVALLGPNGAGKTTLVRAICGRLPIDGGTIELFGRPITRPEALQPLGVVPQDLAIYQDLTAAENLSIFGRLNGLRGRELRHRVAWALEWAGLSDRGGSLVRTLSGGMKRRINLACGVMHSPRLLLLDEPTVGVDPQSRQRIFDMLAELSAGGMTIVLTTHHMDEAQSQCDRILIVDHGQRIADGTLRQLIEQTVGDRQHVRLSIEGEMPSLPSWLQPDLEHAGCFHAYLSNLQNELPRLIEAVESAGGRVADLQVHRSDLHAVFLHLTGKELRE